MGVYPEPFLIGDKNSINSYDLNVITFPNRHLKMNEIINPFTGFTGVYLSPISIKNNMFVPLLKTSQLSWLVDSTTGIDGKPETSFNVAAYGEGSFSQFFTSHYTNKKNNILVLGNSISLTDYLHSINYNGVYDFIRKICIRFK